MIPLSLVSQDGIFLSCTVITRPNFASGFKDNLEVTGPLALTFHVKLAWLWMQRPAETGRRTFVHSRLGQREPPVDVQLADVSRN